MAVVDAIIMLIAKLILIAKEIVIMILAIMAVMKMGWRWGLEPMTQLILSITYDLGKL